MTMSDVVDPSKLCVEPLEQTEVSKELTDKIHRLIRRWSKELVELVSQEIGARAIKVKGKPGPKRGTKYPKKPCPLCNKNPNAFRRFGYICRECRGGKAIKVPNKKHTKGKYSGGYKVVAKAPAHFPLKPKPVEVPDVEPDFLDRIVTVVELPPEPERPRPVVSSDEDFFG
jgi:hypothetical protein